MGSRYWAALALLCSTTAAAQQITVVTNGVEPQPFAAHVARLEEALRVVGSRLHADDRRRLAALRERAPSPAVVAELQRVLDPYVLASVDINPEARVKVRRGPAAAELMQLGWTSFLVKVHNDGAVRAALE